MAPVPKPPIPVNVVPEFTPVQQDIIEITKMFLQNLDKLSPGERNVIIDLLDSLRNPAMKLSDTHLPIEAEWYKTKGKKYTLQTIEKT